MTITTSTIAISLSIQAALYPTENEISDLHPVTPDGTRNQATMLGLLLAGGVGAGLRHKCKQQQALKTSQE